ncbi:MAG TPA: hypothetical protein VLX56_07210 [Nitrososphaerales archaeon]|nr:hypothetical protein [Nitrososphaerales archaeon]
MVSTSGKLPAKREDQRGSDDSGSVPGAVRTALGEYLRGRRLVRVQVRRVEGRTVEGFLKIQGPNGERSLEDFSATMDQDGALSLLVVGGKRVGVARRSSARRSKKNA